MSFTNTLKRYDAELVALLARRPELRDVGIAGYLVDSALNDDATLRRWTTRRVQAQWLAIALMEHMARPLDMNVFRGKWTA